MRPTKYHLSDFTTGCKGLWQNAVFTPCDHCEQSCRVEQRGCLMTASPTGEPILISVKRYERLTLQKVSPALCCATLSKAAFESAYYRYLVWELDSPHQCSLQQLEKKVYVSDT